MDLVPVCPPCHDLVHALHHEQAYKGKGLWYATKEARKRTRRRSEA